MNKPNKLYVAGNKWTVKYINNLVEDGVKCDGLTVCEAREIYIEADLDEIETVSALFHETMHAITFESGLVYILNNIPGADEAVIRAMENMLFPILGVFHAKKKRA